VEVVLLPKPAGWLTLFAFFPTPESALDLVEGLRQKDANESRPQPQSLEWFDSASLEIVRRDVPGFSTPDEARVALFIEQSLDDAAVDEDALLPGWLDALAESGALVAHPLGVVVARTAQQREALRVVRHAIPAGVNERASRNGMPKLGTDLSVPDAQLREIMDAYGLAGSDPRRLLGELEAKRLLESLGRDVGEVSAKDAAHWRAAGLPERLETVTFGHIGDNHVHLNFLPRDAPGLALCREIYAHLTRLAISLGGSPSAEHGIGKIKHAGLLEWVGEAGVEEMRAVKRALDPGFCLGRGNLFEQTDPRARGT
jgi:D-lactate dehydrogenase (cytochrome)